MYAKGVTILPLGVLEINPNCIRNGSYTSSIVVCSSPIEEAIASKAASGYYGLGLYYYYIENNIDKALEYFNQSIVQGYQWSYGILGIIYREGLYVKADFAKAIEYFEKAILKTTFSKYKTKIRRRI